MYISCIHLCNYNPFSFWGFQIFELTPLIFEKDRFLTSYKSNSIRNLQHNTTFRTWIQNIYLGFIQLITHQVTRSAIFFNFQLLFDVVQQLLNSLTTIGCVTEKTIDESWRNDLLPHLEKHWCPDISLQYSRILGWLDNDTLNTSSCITRYIEFISEITFISWRS